MKQDWKALNMYWSRQFTCMHTHPPTGSSAHLDCLIITCHPDPIIMTLKTDKAHPLWSFPLSLPRSSFSLHMSVSLLPFFPAVSICLCIRVRLIYIGLTVDLNDLPVSVFHPQIWWGCFTLIDYNIFCRIDICLWPVVNLFLLFIIFSYPCACPRYIDDVLDFDRLCISHWYCKVIGRSIPLKVRVFFTHCVLTW